MIGILLENEQYLLSIYYSHTNSSSNLEITSLDIRIGGKEEEGERGSRRRRFVDPLDASPYALILVGRWA